MDDLVRQYLTANRDPRKVITDPTAGYFGTPVNDESLTPGPNARLGATRFGEWPGGSAALATIATSTRSFVHCPNSVWIL